MFQGIHTALITPFADGRIDQPALERLIERQIAGGVDGVVVAGTTGESATLDEGERAALFEMAVAIARKRCRVVAGTGTNDTAQSLRLTRAAVKAGCDGALVVTPYYNKPTQEGLYHHFRTLAEAAPSLPQILYNVPSRTGVSLTVDTVSRLADVPGIVAIKEATADLAFGAEIVARCGERLAVLSGDDATAFPLWAVGGRGVISVASNLVPERLAAMWRAFAGGDWEGARRMHLALLPLFRGLFVETSPTPVKTLVAWAMGGFSPDVRLPLVPLQVENEAKLRKLCAGLEIPLG